jgi:nicotinamide-nucleotide amidase
MADGTLISIADSLLALVATLGDALRARGWRLATAESCTGGLLAGACTAPAGASDWFAAGFVTYANDAKTGLLGVPDALIAQHGAVSAEVAEAMARGALAHAGVELALSITGVAGPGGGTPMKPVGTVHFATTRANQSVHHRMEMFDLDTRWDIQKASVQTALEMLRDRMR